MGQEEKHGIDGIHQILYNINGTEEPRAILQWQKDLETIHVGLNPTDPKTICHFTASQCIGAAKDADLCCQWESRKQWPKQVENWRKENFPVQHSNKPLKEFQHHQEVNKYIPTRPV